MKKILLFLLLTTAALGQRSFEIRVAGSRVTLQSHGTMALNWSSGVSCAFNAATNATDCAPNGTLASGQLLVPNGTVAAPSYSFTNFPAYGIYFNTSTGPTFSQNGVDVLAIGTNAAVFTNAASLIWSNGGIGGSLDTGLSRSSAGVVAVGTGAQGSFAGTAKSASNIIGGANGETWTYGQSTELLTIAAAATTDTTANLLPANSIIEAVVVRVNTIIPTAATFTVGDATIAARFATGVAVAATTTAVGTLQADQTGTSGPRQVAAAKVRITPNATPGTATGVVRITVFWRQFIAPTS